MVQAAALEELKRLRWSYTKRVRTDEGYAYEYVERIGPLPGEAFETLLELGGDAHATEVIKAMGRTDRPSRFIERTASPLEGARMIRIEGQRLIVLSSWPVNLGLAREMGGEYEAEERTSERQKREREGFRFALEHSARQPKPEVPVEEADGYIEDLEHVEYTEPVESWMKAERISGVLTPGSVPLWRHWERGTSSNADLGGLLLARFRKLQDRSVVSLQDLVTMLHPATRTDARPEKGSGSVVALYPDSIPSGESFGETAVGVSHESPDEAADHREDEKGTHMGAPLAVTESPRLTEPEPHEIPPELAAAVKRDDPATRNHPDGCGCLGCETLLPDLPRYARAAGWGSPGEAVSEDTSPEKDYTPCAA